MTWYSVPLGAAGGKLIGDGPGAMVIFETDPSVAPAVVGVAVSADTITNVKMQRLFSGEKVRAVRQKRIEIQKSYAALGQ